MPQPDQLTLSGNVYPGKRILAGSGDVAIHPGSGRTRFIDATIYDGKSWRALDLKGFGISLDSRAFGQPQAIGPLMRQIESKIINCKGSLVHYDYPDGSTKRKFIFRGLSFRKPWQY